MDFDPFWGEISMRCRGQEEMRVEEVYGHYFVLWDDAISGQRKVISRSLQALPPPLGGEWEPGPGTVYLGAHPPQSL